MNPRITLEQWQALVAVVDASGYAQAAERLHKSQSSVTYLVQKLESLLDVKAFEIKGRKAVLTPAGQLLYRRARVLLDEAASLEKAAKSAAAGWEAEIRIAGEIIFPPWLLLKCFDKLNAESPHTRIEYFESVIAGTNVSLQVTATGTSPLSYQWTFNGSNLAGATANPLFLATVQPSQAGNYAVVVTNVAGAVTSAVASLTVLVPPAITLTS